MTEQITPDTTIPALVFDSLTSDNSSAPVLIADTIHHLVKGKVRMPLRYAVPAVRSLLGDDLAALYMPAPEMTEVEHAYNDDDPDDGSWTESVPASGTHYYGYQVPGSIARCGASLSEMVTRRYSATTCESCRELLAEDREAYELAKAQNVTPDAGTEDAADITE